MATLKAGETSPSFQAQDQNENSIGSTDFSGRKLFVFFYPKANTSG